MYVFRSSHKYLCFICINFDIIVLKLNFIEFSFILRQLAFATQLASDLETNLLPLPITAGIPHDRLMFFLIF